MKMCSRCNKNAAVIFVGKIGQDNHMTQQGLCLRCAREMGFNQIDAIIKQMGIDPETNIDEIQEMIEQLGIDPEDIRGKDMHQIMENMGMSEEEIQTETEAMQDFLQDMNDKEEVDDEGDFSNIAPIKGSPMDFINNVFSGMVKKEEGKEKTEKPHKQNEKAPKKRKALDNFGTNLTQKAKAGKIDRVIGRDKEVMRIMQILNRRTKNNPVLLGEPGVGKTAIAEGLALRIVEKQVPIKLYDKEIFLLDFAALVAGTQFRGQFEARLKALLDEVKKDGNIVLVIDELHNIVGAGNAEGAMNAANILKPALARGEIQIIGATTLEEYRKHIEKDSALERRFQPVMVDEPTIEETIEIIQGIREYYEEYHNVTIPDDVVKSAAVMSERYIHDRFLPDKAIDLIDEAASKVNLENTGLIEIMNLKDRLTEIAEEKEQAVLSDSTDAYQQAANLKIEECKILEKIETLEKTCGAVPLTVDDVAQVVQQWTNIPVQTLSDADTKKLLELEGELHCRVIGQDGAVEKVSCAIRRGRAGITHKKRPVSFIFVGPTGVGKTELVKALAESLFGSEQALIRLDMSEYMEKHSVSKMIGSPPGYVGYDEAGQLTEKVRRNPYSVLLLDEIEKAHADVFNILLQILDDGRITDSQGRVVNFENTIIIMTSNAGSDLKTAVMGFEGSKGNVSKYDKMLRQLFRPEFLNRIDEIVEFDQLTHEQLLEIVDLLLVDVIKGLGDREIECTVTGKAKELILEKGYEPAFGARPLRRVIMREIEDKVTEFVLGGQLLDGGTLSIDAKENEFTFTCE